jgi:uncharacterized protein (TIGR02598 family)
MAESPKLYVSALGSKVLKAFTLVELLVVRVILLILEALLLPVFNRILERSEASRCQANLRQLGAGALALAAENDGKLPTDMSRSGEKRSPYLAGDARGEDGFSLIEITIAMGVMAFAAIAILGIIPNGLSAAMRSSQTTIAARLASEVQSEIQQVGLASFPTNTTYFDGDGKILASTSGAVYYVYRSVEACSLPGASAGSFQKVIVQVVKNPAGQTFPVDATTGLRTIPSGTDERTFQFHVLP